jgi:hypothetical protein
VLTPYGFQSLNDAAGKFRRHFLFFFNMLAGIFCRAPGKKCRPRGCCGMVRQRLEQSLGIAGHSSGRANGQSEREYATAEHTNASHVSARRTMMMRRYGIANSGEAIPHPAKFAESSISTLSYFLNLSVARPAFLSCGDVFFEISA